MTENEFDNETPPNIVESLKKSIENGEATSEGLAAHIVAYRTLGINKEVAMTCMAELAKRRAEGEQFDFETFVEDEIKKVRKIPEVNLKQLTGNFSIQTLLKMIKK